jgi:hypothetical protein
MFQCVILESFTRVWMSLKDKGLKSSLGSLDIICWNKPDLTAC